MSRIMDFPLLIDFPDRFGVMVKSEAECHYLRAKSGGRVPRASIAADKAFTLLVDGEYLEMPLSRNLSNISTEYGT